jgi:radical SAM/Cys-rich protein
MDTTIGEFPLISPHTCSTPEFDRVLAEHSCGPLQRAEITTVQINLGKLCNQACRHCHVGAGPTQTEIMGADVAERILDLLAASPNVETLDITGGAPELNPNFRRLVAEARRLGRHVIDRCNLTVLFEPAMTGLAGFLAEHEVEIIASLPCYTAVNVDKQRGNGVFEKSIRALRDLNALGYGLPESKLRLNLVYNPLDACLPPSQEKLETDYKLQLREHFGIEFHRLFTLTNMPIARFAKHIGGAGQYDVYIRLLVNHFNSHTVSNLMCRSQISIGWDGKLYDCDFSQMLGIGIGGRARTVWDMDGFAGVGGQRIATGQHCFACTAGNGSSCGGALQ